MSINNLDSQIAGPSSISGAGSVDVVVPVFNGSEVVRKCIESVLNHAQATFFELVVVDDGSTEPETVRYLDDLAARGRILLLRNENTKGFVRSVNRGMTLHADRDVVLLNSDTEVANDWLDRLRRCAYTESDVPQRDFPRGVGTATPFSNNATICSFPVSCADNPLPEGVELEGLDALFARINEGKCLTIPTAVGFCMYIRRACLDEVGAFDEQRFGRGYGEENDFCRRALKAGWRSVLCADTFVYHVGGVTFQAEREELVRRSEPVLRATHPDYFDEVHAFIRQDPAAPLRRAVEIELARSRLAQPDRAPEPISAEPTSPVAFACRVPTPRSRLPDDAGKPVQLHVIHDLGGGIERWCRDYCLADTSRINLILKPFCRGHAAGEGLMLFADINDPLPIGLWIFSSPIEVTTATHPEYPLVIGEIIHDYRVDAVLVSSLIGHSLDILATGLPTVFIGHDYFPSCPAINLYFDGVCESCDSARLVDCLKRNVDFNPFLIFPADERLSVRERFLEILEAGAITMVVPSRTVWNHLLRLFPRLSKASWVTIPHGVDGKLVPVRPADAAPDEKLRIVVLGMLSVNKGMRLLTAAIDRLTEFAEIHLVGALEVGELFLDKPDVHVVTRYALDELQEVIERIRPHVGMLLSIWPESYSYTLSELMLMGVPPVATRVGSFAERIIDGDTGCLVEPSADALLARLKEINADRGSLDRIRSNLSALPRRSTAEMVADYHRLLQVSRREVSADATEHEVPSGHGDALAIAQAVELAALWKNVKSLDLQLTMSKEARPRVATPRQVAENQRAIADNQRLVAESQRAVAENQRAIAEHQRDIAESKRAIAENQTAVAESQRAVAENQRAVAEHQREIAESKRAVAENQRVIADNQRAVAESQINRERQDWQRRIDETERVNAAHVQLLREKNNQVQALTAHVEMKDAQLAEIFSSTSWRLSRPVRALGRVLRQPRIPTLRQLKILGGCLLPILRDPVSLPTNLARLHRGWRSGGLPEVKKTLLELQSVFDRQDVWRTYRRTFNRDVRPRIVRRVAELGSRPLISVIVPTYNTPVVMLREMIQSVQRQLYPDWELCIADDGSSQPHVKKVLEAYAARDPRIKLHLGLENRGVSHASNRALAMATGEFVVLLDHDDILEEQALFRVAECVLEENPDMTYSDEVMVAPDAATVRHYAFRPAYSPELLRAHPYFVHLLGFRRQLLLDIGGFDEKLDISQDYDLILRATEKAQTVVHIPEILYQWRLHDDSAGQQKMQKVMDTSKAILRRHLERCREKGDVNDGVGFNLFDVRYPLGAGLRIAIIIPTKNHGDLVRQCIESIRATVSEVDYEIVVVDHASDDPESLAYFASISPEVRVLRYTAEAFNFSAINNWAVSQLEGDYTHYLLCNNDIEATKPGWLERMLELGQHPSVGIVGARLLYPDGKTIQHAGVCVGTYGCAEHYGKFLRLPEERFYFGFSELLVSNHEVAAVTAACLLIRKAAFEEISGFDESFAVGFGDVDLCLRAGERGYRVLFCPYAELLHHESYTRGKSTGDPHPEDSALFRSKWQELLQAGDPYFNPALSIEGTNWQMKPPMNCSFGIRRRIVKRDRESGKENVTFSSAGSDA